MRASERAAGAPPGPAPRARRAACSSHRPAPAPGAARGGPAGAGAHGPAPIRDACGPRQAARARWGASSGGPRGGVACTAVARGQRAQHAPVTVRLSTTHKVNFGEVIKVVGAGPALGDWNPDAGLLMAWAEGDQWSAEAAVPPGTYDFKCVVVRGDGSVAEWEPGANRKLEVPEGAGPAAMDVVCPWSNTAAMFMSFDEDDGESLEPEPRKPVLPRGLGFGLLRGPAKSPPPPPSKPPAKSTAASHSNGAGGPARPPASSPARSPQRSPPRSQARVDPPKPVPVVPRPATQQLPQHKAPPRTETRQSPPRRAGPAMSASQSATGASSSGRSQVPHNSSAGNGAASNGAGARGAPAPASQQTRKGAAAATQEPSSQGAGVRNLAAALGLLALPIVAWSEWTLKTTGCGLPPGPSGALGAAEGLAYVAVVLLAAGSLVRNLRPGGPAAGGFGLLGAVEGLSFAAIAVGVAVLGYQEREYGYIPSALPDSNCFGPVSATSSAARQLPSAASQLADSVGSALPKDLPTSLGGFQLPSFQLPAFPATQLGLPAPAQPQAEPRQDAASAARDRPAQQPAGREPPQAEAGKRLDSQTAGQQGEARPSGQKAEAASSSRMPEAQPAASKAQATPIKTEASGREPSGQRASAVNQVSEAQPLDRKAEGTAPPSQKPGGGETRQALDAKTSVQKVEANPDQGQDKVAQAPPPQGRQKQQQSGRSAAGAQAAPSQAAVTGVQDALTGSRAILEELSTGVEDGLSSADLMPVVEELEHLVSRLGRLFDRLKARVPEGGGVPTSIAPVDRPAVVVARQTAAPPPQRWEFRTGTAPDFELPAPSRVPLRWAGMDLGISAAATNAASAANNVTQTLNAAILQLRSATDGVRGLAADVADAREAQAADLSRLSASIADLQGTLERAEAGGPARPQLAQLAAQLESSAAALREGSGRTLAFADRLDAAAGDLREAAAAAEATAAEAGAAGEGGSAAARRLAGPVLSGAKRVEGLLEAAVDSLETS